MTLTILSLRAWVCVRAKSPQLCLILCNPVDCSPPSSSVLWARILEWVAMPSSRVSPQPRDQSHVSCLLHWQMGSLSLAPPGFKYLSPLPSLNRLNTSEVLWNVSMKMHSKQEICLVWCILELHWGWPSLNSALADLNICSRTDSI